MRLLLNGAPKMGNHALWKAACLLGLESSGVNHIPYQELNGAETSEQELLATCDMHVFIRRDPRNALMSWVRFQKLPVTVSTMVSAMSDYILQLDPFEPWLQREGVVQVRFEELVSSPQAMQDLATAVGVPYPEEAWESLPNHTKTWTGKLSDYREVWTPALEVAWQARGGNELLTRWGY